MKRNTLESLFNELNKQKIGYNLIRKLPKKFPKLSIPNGVNALGYIEPVDYPKNLIRNVSLKVKESSLNTAIDIIKSKGFVFFDYLDNKMIFYYFDSYLGLIRLEIITNRVIENKNRFFKGKFVCFVSPEGGGKTTTLSAVYTILENFQVERKLINFSSFKKSRLWRVYDLLRKILHVYLNRFIGNLLVSDRYIYLTFRKNKILRKILFMLVPEPDLVFIMKSKYKTLKKRRGPICSSKENVENTYCLFEKAKNKMIINTEEPREKNLELIMNKILRLYDCGEEGKKENKGENKNE